MSESVQISCTWRSQLQDGTVVIDSMERSCGLIAARVRISALVFPAQNAVADLIYAILCDCPVSSCVPVIVESLKGLSISLSLLNQVCLIRVQD